MDKISYIAGLFDGEGCISAQRQFIKTKYEKYPRVSIQISITNMNYECLEIAQSIYGGVISNKGNVWVWRIVGKSNLSKFLNDMKGICIVKKEQILLAIEFVDTLRSENLGSNGLSQYIHAVREEIYIKLRMSKMVPCSRNADKKTPEIAGTSRTDNPQPSPAWGRFRDYNRRLLTSYVEEDGIVRATQECVENGRNDHSLHMESNKTATVIP